LGAGSAFAETKEFKFTGEQQVFEVPAGVTSVHVVAVGGEGGSGAGVTGAAPGAGGLGAVVSSDLSVTPGQKLFVEVGGNGLEGEEPSGIGGFNGGGSSTFGGGGGGASDVRTESNTEAKTLESRLLVAAGGGGGGEGSCEGGQSGGGGNEEEEGHTGTGCAAFGGGGGAGTSTEPGAGGTSSKDKAGEKGGLGAGGHGGFAFVKAGGGGGAGLYGGGGGGEGFAAGGGGGGSNFFPAGGGAKLAEAKEATSVTFTYTVPSCTTAVGRAIYLKRFETGQLNINDNLSTNLEAPQRLIVGKNTSEIRFRLTKLEKASCTGGEGERSFSGEGQAVKFNVGGYHVSFRIYEEGVGKFFFESHLTKEGTEIEATGGPLRTGSQKIF
jgi:hypothetical protein